jgi:hypothetical protein
LWSDFLVYYAFQSERDKHTRFPSDPRDSGDPRTVLTSLLASTKFVQHVRERRVVNMCPSASYLALPKTILSWIHREDAPIDLPDVAYLRRHMPRSYARHERCITRVLTKERVLDDKDRYVLKPAQYGGSHGVQIGRVIDRDPWAASVADIWDDPNWVIQEFVAPVPTAQGEWVSYGLMNYGGSFGGFLLRTSQSVVVNARESSLIAAI